MTLLLLAIILLLSLLILPFGLPGIWIMVGTAWLFGPMLGMIAVGWLSILATASLALASEVAEFLLAGKYTRTYGGSNRAAWASIAGGLIGALIGVPVPIVGSILGAFVGGFVGAWLAEISLGRSHATATRAATGSLIGRLVAVALKGAIGTVIAVWLFAVAAFGALTTPEAPPVAPTAPATPAGTAVPV